AADPPRHLVHVGGHPARGGCDHRVRPGPVAGELLESLGELGLDRTRLDEADGHAVAEKLAADRVVPVGEPGLGRAVGTQGRVRHAGDRRPDVDHRPPPRGERADQMPREQDRGPQVHRELPVQVLDRRVGEQGRQAAPGVVHQHVDAAEPRDRLVGHLLARVGLGEVGRDRQDFDAGRLADQLGGERVQAVGPAGDQD
ncbi:hypothetical protein HK102_012326, partial [Quaeritorhiza haematococci]